MTINQDNKLFTYFKLLDYYPSLKSLHKRKHAQKIVYVIQILVNNLGYKYNWYLYGPYSPALTKVLFNIIEKDKKFKEIDVNQEIKEKLGILKKNLQNDFESSEKMELIASLLYLQNFIIDKKHNPEFMKNDIVNILNVKKPQFSKNQIFIYWKKINHIKEELNNIK